MSFSEFVNNIRLERAIEMLCNTDKNIAEIAYDTGFANVTYFNRIFRRKFKCAPKSIRMDHGRFKAV
ncbi:MAG: helix-turn-helix transcriptional regulator [Bacteroidales bacterium]|nr:helix-turn-helix transcriptional regulator [Bacteroidales bacterium]